MSSFVLSQPADTVVFVAFVVAVEPAPVATKTATTVPPKKDDKLPIKNNLPGSLPTSPTRQTQRGTSRSSIRRPPDGHARDMASIERYDREFPQLRNFNLYASTTSGAGNCLFHALSDQLYGYEHSHLEIRNRCVACTITHNASSLALHRSADTSLHPATDLRQHADYFKPFVEVGSTTRSRPKRSTRGSSKKDSDAYSQDALDRAYEDRLNRMGELGCFGDNLEIQAFTREYDISVKLYQRNNAYVITPWGETSSHVADEDCVHIARHDWEHYSSVRNRTGPHEGPPKVRTINVPAALDAILLGYPYELDEDIVVEALEQAQFDGGKAKELLREKLGHLMLPSPPDSQADTPREVYSSSEADVSMDIDVNSGADATMCPRYTPESTVPPEDQKHLKEHASYVLEEHQESSPFRKRSRSPEIAIALLDRDYENDIKRQKISKESDSSVLRPVEFAASILMELDPDRLRLANEVIQPHSHTVVVLETTTPFKEATPPPLQRSGIRIADLIHPTNIEPEVRLYPMFREFTATIGDSGQSDTISYQELDIKPEANPVELPSIGAKIIPNAPLKKRQLRKKTPAAPAPQPTRRSRRLQAKLESDQSKPSRASIPPPQVKVSSPPESPLSSTLPSPVSITSVESIESTIYVNTLAPPSRQKTAEPAAVVQEEPEQIPSGPQSRKAVQPSRQDAKPKPHAMKTGTGASGIRKRRSAYRMKQDDFRLIFV